MSIFHRGPTPMQVTIARAMLELGGEPKSRRYLRERTLAGRGWSRAIARELSDGHLIERRHAYEMTKRGREVYQRWDRGV